LTAKRNYKSTDRFVCPELVSDGRTLIQAVLDAIIKKPGMTANEIKWAMVKQGFWPEEVSLDRGLASKLRSLFLYGHVGRGKKRLDTAKPFKGPTMNRRMACFTYWPLYVMQNGDPHDPVSIFTGEFMQNVEELNTLMSRPFTQVPMTEVRDRVKWLHAKVVRAELVKTYRIKQPVSKGGKA